MPFHATRLWSGSLQFNLDWMELIHIFFNARSSGSISEWRWEFFLDLSMKQEEVEFVQYFPPEGGVVSDFSL